MWCKVALEQKGVKRMGVKQGLGAPDWKALCHLFIHSVHCFVAKKVLHIDKRYYLTAGVHKS
jgi:hypothetical protein